MQVYFFDRTKIVLVNTNETNYNKEAISSSWLGKEENHSKFSFGNMQRFNNFKKKKKKIKI